MGDKKSRAVSAIVQRFEEGRSCGMQRRGSVTEALRPCSLSGARRPESCPTEEGEVRPGRRGGTPLRRGASSTTLHASGWPKGKSRLMARGVSRNPSATVRKSR